MNENVRKMTYGKMLSRFRKERQLKLRQISEGLCDTVILQNFEKELRIPDILLFERLLERMGVSPEELSLMANEKEYEYYLWREQVCEFLENKNWDELKKILNLEIGKTGLFNLKLETQFLAYVQGLYLGFLKKHEQAAFQMKYAAEQTIPQLFAVLDEDVLLSTMEVHCLLLYLYYGVKGKIIKREEGKKIFFSFEKFLYNGKIDSCEKVKCYPKLICSGFYLFADTIRERDWLLFCEKAIQMLRENKSFEDVTELLRLYIPLLEKRESRELEFYKKQYEVFCDLLEGEGISTEFQPEFLNRSKLKVYLLSEYFRAKRIEKNMTQRMVSEEICEPESYSRIEKGIRTPTPNNYKKLVQKLDIGWCYYRGELDCDELKAFELRRKQRIAMIEGRYYDSLDFLEDLEECLDMKSVVNYQYLTFLRCVILCRLGKMSIEEATEKLQELLYLTQEMKAEETQLIYYSQTELEIIAHLAQLFRKQGKYEDGIKLCEKVIKQMQNGKVGFEYQWSGFAMVFCALSNLYFKIGKYKLTIEIREYVKCKEMKKREASIICNNLDAIADALEHMGKQYSQEYKKLYRFTYYMADFFKNERIIDFAKKYYEDNFDKDIKWYEHQVFLKS